MPYRYPKPGDAMESDLFRLHRMLVYLCAFPEVKIEVSSGVLYVPVGCCEACAESYDLSDFTGALEKLLGIEHLTAEEVEAEEKARFEEGKKRYREEHPEHFEDGVRGPKYWEGKDD